MRLAVSAASLALLALVAGSAGGQEAEYTRKGADTCLSCHEEQTTLALFRGKHAVPSDPRSPFGHGQLQCEACHGPGGPHSGRVRRGQERPPIIGFGNDKPTPVAQQNAMCLTCHDGDMGFGWQNDAHAGGEVACADCHVSHTGSDPVLKTSTQPEQCYECHVQTKTRMQKAFTHPLADGKMDCSSCHAVHGDAVDGDLLHATINDTCQTCHAELRGPFLWEHAPVSEDCGLCHAPHGSNHPGLLSKRGPLLCQSCHSQSGHPSFTFESDGLASEMPSQYLLGQNCMNCHSQVHGSNHPSGSGLMR